MRLLKISLLLVLATFAVMADQPRHRSLFTSANGLYEARLGNDRQWQVVEKRPGKILYSFSNQIGERVWLSSMTLLVSDDGRYVAAIDDYSEQDAPNPEVLYFFENGQNTKSYKLDELINPKFITYSVSHFRWCSWLPKTLKIVNNTVEIKSNELVLLTFDLSSGKLVKKVDDELLQNGSIFVYGTFSKLGKDQYQVKVICSIKGNIKPSESITFTAPKLEWLRDGEYGSWIFRDGKLVSGPLGYIFNNCGSD